MAAPPDPGMAVDDNGLRSTYRSAFRRTEALSLDRQTFPSIAPLHGEKVGVGMPVIVPSRKPGTQVTVNADIHSVPAGFEKYA